MNVAEDVLSLYKGVQNLVCITMGTGRKPLALRCSSEHSQNLGERGDLKVMVAGPVPSQMVW